MRKVALIACLFLILAAVALAQSTYSSFDVPGAKDTTGWGINNAGDITGSWDDSMLNGHGFLLKAGTFTMFDDTTQANTDARALNDYDLIVGISSTPGGSAFGFTYKPSTETMRRFTFPGGSGGGTVAGINNLGTIVGSNAFFQGFTLHSGKFTSLNYPGARTTTLAGVTTSGDVLGYATFFRNTHKPPVSFVYSQGTFTAIDLSGLPNASVSGISSDGSYIVGNYQPVEFGPYEGFFLHNGTFTEIVYPGSIGTTALGVNNGGVVSGGWTDSALASHGFIYTP